MAAGLIALAVVGTALQAKGAHDAAKAQAEQAKNQAFLDQRRAFEVLRRARINNELLFGRAKEAQGGQLAQRAASGRGRSASTQAILDETLRNAERQAKLNTEVSEWEASMIIAGADSATVQAGKIERAGRIQSLGGLGLGLANIAASSPGAGSGSKKAPGHATGRGTTGMRD